MHICSHEPRYTHYVVIHEFEEALRDFIREESSEDDYGILDYSDGDYYYKIDLKMAIDDPTPDEEVAKYLTEELEEEDYPYENWMNKYDDFITYLYWLKIARCIVADASEEIVRENKFAIYVSN